MSRFSVFKIIILGLGFMSLASCGKKGDQYLIVKLVPKDSLVLEVGAGYSCFLRVTGIVGSDGSIVPADIPGPLVMFNRMTIEWKKTGVPLYLHAAKLELRSSGISQGVSKCDLTTELAPLFDSYSANSSVFTGGKFTTAGKITSNPICRIMCPIKLLDENVPEISATGILTLKASEVANENTDEEAWHRVRTTFNVTIRP